jgi:hypothetical protein
VLGRGWGAVFGEQGGVGGRGSCVDVDVGGWTIMGGGGVGKKDGLVKGDPLMLVCACGTGLGSGGAHGRVYVRVRMLIGFTFLLLVIIANTFGTLVEGSSWMVRCPFVV